ncbi:phosphatase PAP2 family protein [Leuconostoc falkenbergense]|uniref:phosphatase PAP2 family protein n=1 Tax=Leuconostoc falkenbergense TaxID=2766470 RepID=UPI001FC8C5FE|nr:phosphatase PAP2 family protein [Leuconostoc falkenbergense]
MSTTQTGLNDIVMSIFSFLGSPVVDLIYIFILAGILLVAGLRIPAIWSVLTIVIGEILAFIVCQLVERNRPIGHLLSDTGYSFPSLHIFSIFTAIFILLLLVTPNITSLRSQLIGGWAIILVGLMSLLSRLYFSANYLSDTIASILFAYAWVILAASLYATLANRLTKLSIFKNEEI